MLNDAQCIAAIVALVAAVRAKLPTIDGILVLLLSCAVGIGLAFLTGDAGAMWRWEVQRGILFGLAASGGMQALSYHATKSATGVIVSSAAVSVPPPEVKAEQRGFVRPVTLLWLLAGSLSALAIAAALTVGCAAKPFICPIIKAADELCPLVVVQFQDGHSETFRRDDLVAGARKEAAARAARDGQ